MSETLLMIETEGTITAACCAPSNSLRLCYATITNLLVVRELVGPQEQSASEIDSDLQDFENKLKPHSEILVSVETDDIARQLLWLSSQDDSQTYIYVALRSKLLIYLFGEQEVALELKLSIKPATTISKIFYYQNHVIIGADTGDVYIYRLNDDLSDYSLVKTLDDAADYISGFALTDEVLMITSGDGTLYMYNTKDWTKIDNSSPEECDFSAVAIQDSLVVVGTQVNKVLIYKLQDIALPSHQIKLQADVEFLLELGEIVLVGLSNGELRGLFVSPPRDIGVLSKVQDKPLLIGSMAHDLSIGIFGGVDNRLYVLNFEWLLDGEQNKAIAVTRARQDGFQEQDDQTTELIHQMEYEEEEECENEPEDPSALLDLPSKSDSSLTENDKNVKVIKPGHIASDSSFSDFFKFEKREKSAKEKHKENTFGKDGKQAQKKEFFKDL